ncbi:MAG: hypothetical protein R2838_02245 [Caldilineaceae bacterium]
MYNSVICTEDADFVPDDANLDGVRPSFSAGFVEELDEYIAACDLWQVPPFGAEIDAGGERYPYALLGRVRSHHTAGLCHGSRRIPVQQPQRGPGLGRPRHRIRHRCMR